MNSFYTNQELKELNFKSVGDNVSISKKASIYGAENISIGSNVRIDDFCILSGNITIGNYVHISAFCALYGRGGIEIGDYCGCSPRSTLFSATDDFSGEHMISPLVPEKYTSISTGLIKFERFAQIGANSIVMPGVTLKEGSTAGTFSYITSDLESWSVNVGIPAKKIKDRKKNILELSKQLENEINEK